MTDLSQFAAEGFDPKAWINAACLTVPEGDTLDRHLAGLEMRLALASEDVEANLADASDQALRRIPAAAAEVTALQEDVTALRRDMARLVQDLSVQKAEAAAGTASLAVLDRVKTRMEAACSTLKEATELSELFRRVEAVFAGGDVAAIAALLSRMRASLALVGHVPEFAGGLERLEALEDRFQGLVEGSLAAAFAGRQGDRVAQLAGMMAAVGRGPAVAKLYTVARLQPLQTRWDGFDPAVEGGFAGWLPGFYGEVEAAAEAESRWLAGVLPEQAAALATGLLAAMFSRIDKPFRMRLTAALAPRPERPGASLAMLAQLHSLAVATARRAAGAIVDATREQLRSFATALYSPFEAQIARYGEMEARLLTAELAAIQLPGGGGGDSAAAPDTEAVVAGLGASTGSAVAAVQAAAHRASELTGGTGLQALLAAADSALSDHVARQAACLAGLRERVLAAAQRADAAAGGSSPIGDTAGGEGAAPQLSEEGAAVLPLLPVSAGAARQVGVLDARLRAAALALRPALEAAADSEASDALDPVALRLQASEGAALRIAEAFLESAADARFVALPAAMVRVSALQAAANALVFDVLMVRVKEQLGGLARQADWAAPAPANDFGLPSFSAYPGPAVAGAGEYLMMLPQLLEGALDASEGDEDSGVDGDWLDKVAAGAAEEYLQALNSIASLSAAGAGQAAADAEYFCNVLSALGVQLPPALGTWQLAVGLPPEEFAAADTSQMHGPTLATIAQKRGLPVPAAAAVS